MGLLFSILQWNLELREIEYKIHRNLKLQEIKCIVYRNGGHSMSLIYVEWCTQSVVKYVEQ